MWLGSLKVTPVNMEWKAGSKSKLDPVSALAFLQHKHPLSVQEHHLGMAVLEGSGCALSLRGLGVAGEGHSELLGVWPGVCHPAREVFHPSA